MTTIMGARHFERLFDRAAGLDPDKSDLKRLNAFLEAKLQDMLLMAQASARSNDRDVIMATDLPVTKGLQEVEQRYERMEEADALEPVLERFASAPRLDLALGTDAEERLPSLAGALTIALAETFTVLEPDLKNPQTEHWDRAIRIFDLLL